MTRTYQRCPNCRKRGVYFHLCSGGNDCDRCRYCEWFAYRDGHDPHDIRERQRLEDANREVVCIGHVFQDRRDPYYDDGWDVQFHGRDNMSFVGHLRELRDDGTVLHRGVHPDPEKRPYHFKDFLPDNWSCYWFEWRRHA